jgi:hypothetical protein
MIFPYLDDVFYSLDDFAGLSSTILARDYFFKSWLFALLPLNG